MSKIRVGTLSLNSNHYADEANKTVGAALIADSEGEFQKRLSNRRSTTSKLTEAGRVACEKVVAHFKKEFGLNVKLVWSRYAGCTMCPCSPGFKIMADVEKRPYVLPNKEDFRFFIFVNESEKLEVRKPQSIYRFDILVKTQKAG